MAAPSITSLVEDFNPAMATNRYAVPGQNGSNGTPAKPGGPSKPLPHVDDLLYGHNDINKDQSIRLLLEMGQSSMNTAEMSRDLGRPAEALRQYVRASIICVQIVPHHRDFPSLKSQRPDSSKQHQTLLRKIDAQSDGFMEIKAKIVADNKRTGVKATVQQAGAKGINDSPRPDVPSAKPVKPSGPAPAPRQVNGSPAKAKPAVQPKPQALHGNAIGSSHTQASPGTHSQSDLLKRFAELRGPTASPGQDSRIKTHKHQVMPPKPAGPREMPTSVKPDLAIQTAVASLPRVPDAIYSPARGNVSGEAARLPTSNPRSMFSRTGSSTSLASTPSARQNSDYFPPSQSQASSRATPKSSESWSRPPHSTTLTRDELYAAMKDKNSSILLIDVRDREDFDEGHIMYSSIICIEPSVLAREGVSGEQISDSLVLSPNNEQDLFDRRSEFDLVIFYDQESIHVPVAPDSSGELALQSLHRALVDYSYGHELKQAPKLLKEGLDGWIDLMGPRALQSAEAFKVPQIRRSGALARRRRSKYTPTPLRPDEVQEWNEMLRQEESSSSPTFVRSREDFLRRFPSVSEESESMTSPIIPPTFQSKYGASRTKDPGPDLPTPPARPAAARARQSNSGLSQPMSQGEYEDDAPAPKALTRTRTTDYKDEKQAKHFTGLYNPQNWCYANSLLQSLRSSAGFGRQLANSEWAQIYKVQRKQNEKIDQPQLMTRILSNLFHWMETGEFKVMKAQTLMDYSRHRCAGHVANEIFGGSSQHDANEFMMFLFQNLDEETNRKRHVRPEPLPLPDIKRQSFVSAAAEYWQNYLRFNDSLVDTYWRGLELNTVECKKCGTRTYRFEVFDGLQLTFEHPNESKVTLDDLLSGYSKRSDIDGFQCDTCQCNTKAQQWRAVVRLPSLLCLNLQRIHMKDGGAVQKSKTAVTFDLNDFDFSPLFLKAEDGEAPKSSLAARDRAYNLPFRYECYAVITHSGSELDSGHYFTHVRDTRMADPKMWWRCEDEGIQKKRIATAQDAYKEIFQCRGNATPYIMFFRRKN